MKLLVVGGCSGLVRPYLISKAKAGDTIAITGRKREELKKVAAEIAAAAPDAPPVHIIVIKNPLSERQISASVAALKLHWKGRIDSMLIAIGATGGDSAKILPGQDLATVDLDGWRENAELNLWGPLRWIKIVGAWMMKQKTPSAIGFIGSISSHECLSVVGGYGISKAGLSIGYKVLAEEMTRQRLARKLPLIRMNEVAPGFFPTDQNAKLLVGARRRSVLSRTPAGRFGTPADLVDVFTSVTQPEGFQHMSRTVVDGGFSGFSGVVGNRKKAKPAARRKVSADKSRSRMARSAKKARTRSAK